MATHAVAAADRRWRLGADDGAVGQQHGNGSEQAGVPVEFLAKGAEQRRGDGAERAGLRGVTHALDLRMRVAQVEGQLVAVLAHRAGDAEDLVRVAVMVVVHGVAELAVRQAAELGAHLVLGAGDVLQHGVVDGVRAVAAAQFAQPFMRHAVRGEQGAEVVTDEERDARTAEDHVPDAAVELAGA